MAEEMRECIEEASADDGDVWSDASGDVVASANESASQVEGFCDEACEESSESQPFEEEDQRYMWRTIVELIAPLGEKMNLVQQEVSSMKRTIRTEVQGEMQKMQNQIDAVNERMNRFGLLLQQQTSGNGAPTTLSPEAPLFVPRQTPATPPATSQEPVRHQQKVPRYDGSAVWEAYLAQFSILSQEGRWTEDEKAFFLSTSLEGKALTVLANMAAPDRRSFVKLVAALESRFGARHQQQQSRMALSTTRKKPGEPLQEFVETMKRRVMLAYPEASSEIQDALALHHLTTAVEASVRSEILRQKPKTLQEALEVVATEEAIGTCCNSSSRTAPVRSIEEEVTDLPEASTASGSDASQLAGAVGEIKDVLQLLKHHLPQSGGRKTAQPRRFTGSCWYCHKQGHMQRDCRAWREDMQAEKRSSQPQRAQPGN